ncbi:MAG: class I SAM-dependent methyltransferase [Pseudomonadales bacterium]
MTLNPLIPVLCADEVFLPMAQAISGRISSPVVRRLADIDGHYYLRVDAQGVALCQCGAKAPGPVFVDFSEGKARHRRLQGGGKGQLIARAVGLNKVSSPSVLDATAGLGQDAWVLASLGCTVHLLERSAIVAALLIDGWQRALTSSDGDVASIATRMTVESSDALTYLLSAQAPVADVIYLDPMYPHSKKTAAVKKEMSSFRDIVGTDEDSGDLLAAALEKARYRVVVKRPRIGAFLGGRAPATQLSGKSSRYDIYTLKKMG